MHRGWSAVGLPSVVLVCTSALVVFLWLWLPVRLDQASPYASVTLTDGLRLRAWAGTVAALWGRSGLPGAMRPMLVLNLLAWLLWLVCCLWLAARHAMGAHGRRWVVSIFWVVMLGFTAVSFNAYLGFFVDTVAAAWIALTAAACVRYMERPAWKMRVLMAVAPIMAVLTHESSLTLWAVIVLWCVWKVGLSKTIAWFLPTAILVAALLSLAPAQSANGLSLGEYARIGLQQSWVMLGQSANFYGILAGPGLLWVVFAHLGVVWMRQAKGVPDKWHRAALLGAMLLMTLSPLLVAYDTNRFSAALWLPVVLLASDTGGSAWNWLQTRWWSIRGCFVAMLAVQVLNPPCLIYRNGIVPYNCYAWLLSQGLRKSQAEQDMAPWQLRVYSDNYLAQQAAAQCVQ